MFALVLAGGVVLLLPMSVARAVRLRWRLNGVEEKSGLQLVGAGLESSVPLDVGRKHVSS